MIVVADNIDEHDVKEEINLNFNTGSPQWRLPVCSPALGAGWEAGCILSSSRKHPKLGFLTHTFIDKGQYHHHLDHNHQDELDEQRSQRGRRAS